MLSRILYTDCLLCCYYYTALYCTVLYWTELPQYTVVESTILYIRTHFAFVESKSKFGIFRLESGFGIELADRWIASDRLDWIGSNRIGLDSDRVQKSWHDAISLIRNQKTGFGNQNRRSEPNSESETKFGIGDRIWNRNWTDSELSRLPGYGFFWFHQAEYYMMNIIFA